jgi:hypothetical protein
VERKYASLILAKFDVLGIPLSSVVERITSNDEVSRSSRLAGITFGHLCDVFICNFYSLEQSYWACRATLWSFYVVTLCYNVTVPMTGLNKGDKGR